MFPSGNTKMAALPPGIAAKRQGFNWIARICCLCALIRGLQNLESSRKGTGLFFSLVRKEPKVHQRSADLWTPGTAQIAGRNDVFCITTGFHHITGYAEVTISRSIDGNDLNRCEPHA